MKKVLLLLGGIACLLLSVYLLLSGKDEQYGWAGSLIFGTYLMFAFILLKKKERLENLTGKPGESLAVLWCFGSIFGCFLIPAFMSLTSTQGKNLVLGAIFIIAVVVIADMVTKNDDERRKLFEEANVKLDQ